MKKMVMVVVPRDEAENVMSALVDIGHTATFIESRGGMLRQSQMTLYIAIEEDDLEEVLDIVHRHCRVEIRVESEENVEPVTADIGFAVVFVWNLDRFEKY
jgi:uncharacterized protein YaaQ